MRLLRTHPVRAGGAYVLYWMTAARRPGWNAALDRAVAHATALDRPLVIVEALRLDYPWASTRHHRFALDGMAYNREVFSRRPVLYHPYVEPDPGAGRGLLRALAADACVVVTDDTPQFFLPRMLEAAARQVRTRLEAVDSCGLLPLTAADRTFSAAVHFRRFLQRTLGPHLTEMPHPDPTGPEGPGAHLPAPADVPGPLRERWPTADPALLGGDAGALEALGLDGDVPPVSTRGGAGTARTRLDAFLASGLDRYGEERNHPDADASSGLSPWLHWGHLSVHEIFVAVARREGWSPARLGPRADGKREGWWGMSPSAEAFLDELVTWRELGFNFCRLRPDYREYAGLPDWARATLADHAADPRPWRYTLEEFEEARTHDPVWNAAQRQLRGEGVIHNYLRMLWGKKILEWSASPQEALHTMVHLNNRWAVDGRDPNSWTGIMWVLGRFDRGWPERPVYGKVRSMSSERTRRKVRMEAYLARWGG